MEPEIMDIKDNKEVNNSLQRMLDRGIDDMEAGNELPVGEAFKKIDELLKRIDGSIAEADAGLLEDADSTLDEVMAELGL